MEKDKKLTIKTEMYDALMRVPGGKLSAEKAEEIAAKFAKDWDPTNEALAHKGFYYWAREIVARMSTPEKEPGVSYLIAKKYSGEGCVAVKTESGKALANLVSYLSIKTMDKGIQILTVSNPETFGEYKPYHFLNSEKEFISKVFEMMGD